MDLKETWFRVLDDMLKLGNDIGECAVEAIKTCTNAVETWVKERRAEEAANDATVETTAEEAEDGENAENA